MRFRTAAFVAAGAVALALAVFPAAAHAVSRHGAGGDGAEHILHLAKMLDLTDAQTAQIQAIVANQKDGASGAVRPALRDAKATLARTIHDPGATDDQVRDAAATVAALESQVAVQRHKTAIEIQAVLTPDQKAKLQELMATFHERHPGMRGGDRSGS
jgi:Spy/CpxP family protein refolding chaperone